MNEPQQDSAVALPVRLLLAAVAVVAESAAVWLLVTCGSPPQASGAVLVAVCLHAVAGLACARTVPHSESTYRDAMLVAALVLPGLGPLIAWLLVRRRRDGAVNAHAFFENYEQEVHGEVAFDAVPAPARTRPVSFHDVLRAGSLDHRRNALRKLAERGQPMHLRLLRRCLSHSDMELRLGAFAEINRLLRQWEGRLCELRAAVDAQPDDPAARAQLSAAHRGYAASGLLDEDMARFQLRQAANACRLAGAAAANHADLAIERALVCTDLGDLDGASAVLGRLADEHLEDARVCIARARIAFLQHRFDRVRSEAEKLHRAGEQSPRWMREMCPDVGEALLAGGTA